MSIRSAERLSNDRGFCDGVCSSFTRERLRRCVDFRDGDVDDVAWLEEDWRTS
jgi:hypothetical protein